MKILIVDDEQLARQRLRSVIEEIGDDEVVGDARNAEQALAMIQSLQPEVVLLDIRMPGMSGIEAASHIMKLDEPPAIIFVTAYDDYALEAFEHHAVDYLLKPVRKQRLQQALLSAQRLSKAQLKALGNRDNDHDERKHISARLGGELRLIPIEEIRYFMAEHKYVTVRYLDGTVLIEESLKKLEHTFEQRFLRVHRNALVSVNHITALEKDREGKHRVRFRDLDDSVEVSRRHLPTIRKLMRSV